MKLKKIVEAYQLSEKFCEFLKKFEKDKTMYGQLEENSDYLKFERLSQYMVQNHKPEMIIGGLGYFFRHPITMYESQKYFHKGFGVPCKMRK